MRLAIHIISTFLFCLHQLFSYFCSRKSAGFPFTSFILCISTIYWYKNQLFFPFTSFTLYLHSTVLAIGKDNQRFFLLHLLLYTGYIYGLLVKNPLFFTLYRVNEYLLATHFSIFYKFDVFHSSLFPARRYNSKRTFKTAEQWTGLFRQKCIYVMKINI